MPQVCNLYHVLGRGRRRRRSLKLSLTSQYARHNSIHGVGELEMSSKVGEADVRFSAVSSDCREKLTEATVHVLGQVR